MIVTSDSTALTAINTDARTGRPACIKLLAASELGVSPRPTTRPTTRNTNTGITIDPNAPSGSRMNILISSQVSFHSPRSIIFSPTLESSDQSVSETHPQDWVESSDNM